MQALNCTPRHHASLLKPSSSSRSCVIARVGGFGGGPAFSGGQGPAPPDVVRDPENLYKGVPVRTGVIERRMMTKRMETDKEFAKAMANASDELKQQAILRRETRRPPANNVELIEYFLNTLAEDMEYEVARYRPRLTPDFFQYLDEVLGQERFSAEPDEEALAELDLLRRYLTEAAAAVDKCVEATATAKERLKTLLASKDKKATILDMAAANEIDQALIDLLTQNVEAAKNAGQEDAAKFMEKVKVACLKYMVRAPSGGDAAMPSLPGQLGTRPESTGIPIIGASAASAPSSTPSTATTTPPPSPLIIDPKKNDPSGMRSAGKLII